MCSVKRSSKNFAKFTGKHLYQGLLLMKLLTFRLATSLKRDSSTGVFLRILWHFQEHLFYRTPPMDAPGVQRRTLQFVKHLGWSSFSKELAVESCYFFGKSSTLYVWLASEYAFEIFTGKQHFFCCCKTNILHMRLRFAIKALVLVSISF